MYLTKNVTFKNAVKVHCIGQSLFGVQNWREEPIDLWRWHWLNSLLTTVGLDSNYFEPSERYFLELLETSLNSKPNSFNSKIVADSWILVSQWWPVNEEATTCQSQWRIFVVTTLSGINVLVRWAIYKPSLFNVTYRVATATLLGTRPYGYTFWTMISDEDQRHPLTRFPLPVRI